MAVFADDGRVKMTPNKRTSYIADMIAPTLHHQHNPHPNTSLRPPPPPPKADLGHGQGPPSMNIVIQIVGSRGDVQPFVALGKTLSAYGHRVRIATHPTFAKFVRENDLEFFSIGGDPAELMAFMVKNPGLMPGADAVKTGEVSKRRRGIEEMMLGCWRSCIEAGDGLEATSDEQKPFVADAIIANPPSFAHIHIAERLGIPLHLMFTMPWSPTTAFPHPLANIQQSAADGGSSNYMSYAMVEVMTWQGLGDVVNRFRTKVLGLDPIALMWAPGLFERLRIPYTYCWSPALIPKPGDWGDNIDISGFFFLDLASSFTPPADLDAFLRAGPPPVYIGFGSIVVDDPVKLTKTIFEAVHLAGVRALVSKGWGGIGGDDQVPEGVFMLGNVPHDWLFGRVSAVCHHGGAGTCSAGIKAGRPTAVVPFFGDQPFWGAMVNRAGAGPEPIPHADLTAEKLAAAIRYCLLPETQARARELGARIREEAGTAEGCRSFHRPLQGHKINCDAAPGRCAAWKVRKTTVKLSPFAAAVLVRAGELKYSDLKLYRSIEYSTEEQPWDPFSATTAALIGDMSSIAAGIATVPHNVIKGIRASNKRGKSPSPGPSSSTQEPPNTPSSSQMHASQQLQVPSCDNNQVEQQESSNNNAAEVAKNAAIQVGEGIGGIVGAAVKSPMNFSVGLAKGLKYAPRLYHDELIRQPDKIDSFSSGLKVAGKELALGFYDGVAGLAVQPWKGAVKEGPKGFIKGFGKGVGGLIFKPAAGMFGLPAYSMQGIHAHFRAMFSSNVPDYIIASRIQQGEDDFKAASDHERNAVLARWWKIQPDLKKWHQKGKDKEDDPYV
ncbi:Glyco-transf-28 domain-containing protein [Fusarium sp. LHS14.1]|nr:Glyco-transf-28 domain-containing protein [Fusarium sp. LHS14.1]